jgi:hypothetical protein
MPRYTPARLALVFAGLLFAACGQGAPTTALSTATSVQNVAPTQGPTGSPVPTALPSDSSGAPNWTVEIVQGGQVIPAENGAVRLARAPFTMRVTLPQALPVKLNVNADDANFIALQPGYVFTEDCLDALCTGMDVAEERLNPTQELFVDPQSTHYLYYQGPDDHRWSRATVGEGSAVFERDVAVLNTLPIQEFGASELYLLLFTDSANPGVIDPGELQKIVLLLQ